MREHDYQQRSGSWVSSVLWMLSGGAIAATAAIGLGGWQWSDRVTAAFNSLLNPAKPEPNVVVQSIVLQQVRDASELTTASFTMQAVVPTEQDTKVGSFAIGKTKLLYIAQGEVQAGVDLSQVKEANVQTTGDSLRIQLPPPKILSSKIDVNKSQVYEYNRGFLGLGPDSAPELQSLAQQEALTKVEAAACQEGLLLRANDRAKFVVTQLLNTAGYKAVTVETQPIPAEACSSQRVNQPAPQSTLR